MKQSILARLAQLAKANLKALLGSAEDPQNMLDQMVRDGEQWGRRQVRALALVALGQQMTAESTARAQAPGLAAQNPVINKPKGSGGVTLSQRNECCWIR